MSLTVDTVVNTVDSAVNSNKTPANTLPPFLLKCASFCRSGLSAYKTAMEIIENNKLLGIPTEPNKDGSENLINLYTYNVVKTIFKALQNDAAVHVSVPMESLTIKADGGNAGGPVTVIGTNILDAISKGIII